MKNHRFAVNHKRDEIRKLVAAGKTTKEIHSETGYPIATIRYYREPSKHDNCRQISSKISEHRRKVKKKAVAYSGGQCLRCNYKECEAALTFHHLDPSKKDHKIVSGKCLGWDKTKSEIDKTILVCYNCHIEHHAGLWNPGAELVEVQDQIREQYRDMPLSYYKI